MQCWQCTNLWNSVNPCIDDTKTVADIMFSILQKLDHEQQELFSVMLWSLWKCRNNQVWDNVTDNTHTICERARHLLTSWKNSQQVRSLVSTEVSQVTQHMDWTKPSSGRYKCNIDASFSSSLNKVGIGICIRDDQGRFVIARTEWLTPIMEVEVGEAIGLLHALKWVEELQISDMDFEVDCKRVVDSLHSNKNHASDLCAIIIDCRRILATSLMNSHVKFIRRQANEAAHRLARQLHF
ncbi:hypothetical protein TSUD_393980 [Trifolium subterraneum]|uniref:RNase H type-1 domain-containing protein n=1 Tax=Trifolium subterraneum TaxID=3900 RepID=A0A2Z6MPL5_TRISU|nr:hypothetical protein TSUD_393980 [Trifolium subterraneum]